MASELTTEQARKVYDILIEECGASPKQFDQFVAYMLEPDPYNLGKEFRFGGNLGTGGKFYVSHYDWRVGCYSEDLTADNEAAIDRANEKLGNIQPYRRLPPKGEPR